MIAQSGVTGVTSTNFQIEKPVFGIGVSGSGFTAATDAAALTHLQGIKFTISHVSGTETIICRELDLATLAEFATGREGNFAF